jgi:hypothetical protein
MALEKITKAQLVSASKPTGKSLQKSLSNVDSTRLLALLNRTANRYPNQDLTDAMPEFEEDLRKLIQKYSLLKVEMAVDALRIKAGQKFFPTPDVIAEEIEAQEDKSWAEREYRRTKKMFAEQDADRQRIAAERAQ